MGSFQFSVRGSMLALSVFALGFAGMVDGTPGRLFEACFLSGTFGIYAYASLAALFRRGVVQAFWVGFSLVGLAYVALVVWQLHLDLAFNYLVTTKILFAIGRGLPDTTTVGVEQFFTCGQVLWSLLFGYAAGCLARYFYLDRQSDSPRQTS